ncbi:MAG: hypothetical protein ABW032_07610 [Burkholderiaceae bacterium]
MIPPRSKIAPPAAALVAVAFSIANAFAHAIVAHGPPPKAAMRMEFDVLQAEIRRCEAVDGRSREACASEAEGKALIRRAEELDAAERAAQAEAP